VDEFVHLERQREHLAQHGLHEMRDAQDDGAQAELPDGAAHGPGDAQLARGVGHPDADTDQDEIDGIAEQVQQIVVHGCAPG